MCWCLITHTHKFWAVVSIPISILTLWMCHILYNRCTCVVRQKESPFDCLAASAKWSSSRCFNWQTRINAFKSTLLILTLLLHLHLHHPMPINVYNFFSSCISSLMLARRNCFGFSTKKNLFIPWHLIIRAHSLSACLLLPSSLITIYHVIFGCCCFFRSVPPIWWWSERHLRITTRSIETPSK